MVEVQMCKWTKAEEETKAFHAEQERKVSLKLGTKLKPQPPAREKLWEVGKARKAFLGKWKFANRPPWGPFVCVGKSQTLHYIAAQPSQTRRSVVLFVKSKIFKRQFLPTFATRCKLSSHWCLKSRHSSCWDPGRTCPPTFPTGVGYCGALQPPQAKTPQNPLWHFCAS